MDKYAIFLDFDGTLSLENKISKENIEAIKKAQSMGHYVFISTGRNRPGIEPIASGIHNFDGYISGLGSHISLGNEVIQGKYFAPNDAAKVIKMIAELGHNVVIGCTETTFAINPDPEQRKYFTVTTLDEFMKICEEYHIQKIESRNTRWTEEEMTLLQSVSTAYVHVGYTECCPQGCSKSKAIDVVADRLGIKLKNTIAMGDSANDLDMILSAGVGVVMGDAPDFMKEKADFVSKSCREHGVAYAINELILNKKA